uniref:DNA-directed RNA polymerase n=1 Tax=Romanomermis culicivorax TaxID=13658 RepID=A0A915J3T8_ROMCU
MATKNPLEYRTPSSYIDNLSLRIFTNEEILSSSCKEICNPQTFDQLMHPVEGGLYDPAMGIQLICE